MKQQNQVVKMEHKKALKIAQKTMALLAPHCDRIAIAGSIRRNENFVKDIEILVIAKPFVAGIFATGIAVELQKWPVIRGCFLKTYPLKNTQRMLPEGIILDLTFTTPEHWGMRLATRTGPALYSHKVLSVGYCKRGYKSVKGDLIDREGRKIPVYEEEDFFKLIGIDYVEPQFRKYP